MGKYVATQANAANRNGINTKCIFFSFCSFNVLTFARNIGSVPARLSVNSEALCSRKTVRDVTVVTVVLKSRIQVEGGLFRQGVVSGVVYRRRREAINCRKTKGFQTAKETGNRASRDVSESLVRLKKRKEKKKGKRKGLTVLFASRRRSGPVTVCLAGPALKSNHVVAVLAAVGRPRAEESSACRHSSVRDLF